MHIIKPIAHIRTDFSTKFGVPRQSNLVKDLRGMIIMEPEYRNPDAFRGLEGFSWLWIIWQFSETICEEWSPTVRPPRLGGNTRKGVFATRSPFRPNSLGLSSVKIEEICLDHPECGPVIYVSGIDMMDGTPIFDIKPYVPAADVHEDAMGGFSTAVPDYRVQVIFPQEMLERIPIEKRDVLMAVLAEDPRPAYQRDPDRVYGFGFAGFEIKFKVRNKILTVCQVEPEYDKIITDKLTSF